MTTTPLRPLALPADHASPGLGTDAARETAVLVEGLSYLYPGATEPALSGIHLRLGRGSVTLVTGPSGSGKSTLLRALAGLVPHFTGGTVTGSIRVAGAEPIRVGPTGMAGRVGLVSGDPESAFVMDVVGDEVAFALEQRALPPEEIERRVVEALSDVGLPDAADRTIASLSGGERQRVAIATAMAARPAVLLLDEPTSQLDDRCADEVLAAVQHLVRTQGVTVIVTEHRLGRVLHAASNVVALPGPAAESRPPGPPPGAAGLAPARSAARSEPVVRLELSSVAVSYGGRPVLRDASLVVRSGEIVLLTGASGTGKTTLLRTAVGLMASDRGLVAIDGARPSRDAAVFRRVGYLAQDPSSLLLADSVSGELALTLRSRGLPDEAVAGEALLAHLGLAGLADAYPRDLSTGQRQRLALAAIAVGDPVLLVLDEPTRGLDDGAAERLVAFLRRRAGAGTAILVASHDRRLAAVADRRLRLIDGRIFADTAPMDRVHPPVIPKARRLTATL